MGTRLCPSTTLPADIRSSSARNASWGSPTDIPPRCHPINIELEITDMVIGESHHVGRAAYVREHLLYLAGKACQRLDVRAENRNREIATRARRHFRDAHL
jgi:hypothetical protein